METFIITGLVGILLCILGGINMSGNISTLHSYHRHRVKKEDEKPFGIRVGLGTILCGVGCIFFGLLFLISELAALTALVWVGTAGLILFLAVGISITVATIIKYNKGLF